MALDGSLFEAYLDTLRPLVIGLLISAFIGIALGLWIGLTSWFDWLVSPIFIVMQAAPACGTHPRSSSWSTESG